MDIGMETISEVFDLFGEDMFCSICQEDCVEKQRIRSFFLCKHSFHLKCIDTWLKDKSCCPTCRQTYDIPLKKEESYEDISDVDRLFLTYTVIHGLLKKFKKARDFNEKKETLLILLYRIRFENYRLLPLELDSRSSLLTMKQYVSNRIVNLTRIAKTTIHRHPNVYRWIDKIETHPELSCFVRF